MEATFFEKQISKETKCQIVKRIVLENIMRPNYLKVETGHKRHFLIKKRVILVKMWEEWSTIVSLYKI
jgi:hypothetical protein